MVRLYLLRHGETRYNRENLGLGRADIELTAVGKKQSELTADSLEGVVFEMIYSSPLSRAAYLANLVDREGNRTIKKMDALMEMDVGKTEGMKLSDVRDVFPVFIKEWAGPNKIYVANTIQQKNPLYKIVDRPEGPEIFKNKHKKLFNKKLLKMEYI